MGKFHECWRLAAADNDDANKEAFVEACRNLAEDDDGDAVVEQVHEGIAAT